MILNPLFALAALAAAHLSAHALIRLFPWAATLSAPSSTRQRALDGLRGYLAMSVFVHHAVINWFFVRGLGWNLPPSILFSELGQSGVGLFFMVTAFLFWGRVLDRRGDLSWSGFFVGRIFRLYPAYLVMLAFVLIIVAVNTRVTLAVTPSELAKSIGPWLLLSYPGHYDINGFVGTGRLVAYATWSLPYEMVFYILLPLAATVVFRRFWPLTVLICLAMLGILAWLAGGTIPFFLMPFLTFAGGIAAAHAVRFERARHLATTKTAAAIGAAALLIVLFGVKTAYSFAGIAGLTLFFLPVAAGNSFWGILHTKTAVFLGQISYSLYLLHGLLIYLICDRLDWRLDHWRSSEALYMLLSLLAVPILVLIAGICAHWIEQPAIRLGRRLSAR